jgi:hypothetical protein
LTEEKNLSAVEAFFCLQRACSKPKQAFREAGSLLQKSLGSIPVISRKQVQAHVFIGALSFCLDLVLKKSWKALKLSFSTERACNLPILRPKTLEANVEGTKHREVTAGK